eukprot:COSAG01_NODE_63658_length_279_cov_0.633333_1_plen_22_part_01
MVYVERVREGPYYVCLLYAPTT